MAIRKTIETASGVSVINAYHRVVGVCLDGKNKISFSLQSSVDASKPYFNSAPYSCAYDLDGQNPIKQAYDFLKTTAKFIEAEDC